MQREQGDFIALITMLLSGGGVVIWYVVKAYHRKILRLEAKELALREKQFKSVETTVNALKKTCDSLRDEVAELKLSNVKLDSRIAYLVDKIGPIENLLNTLLGYIEKAKSVSLEERPLKTSGDYSKIQKKSGSE